MKLNKRILVVVCFIPILLFHGCISIKRSPEFEAGYSMSSEQYQRIMEAIECKLLKTGLTREEVVSIMGEPQKKQYHKGLATIIGVYEAWFYTARPIYYDEAQIPLLFPTGAVVPIELGGFSKRVILHFDKDGKLKKAIWGSKKISLDSQ